MRIVRRRTERTIAAIAAWSPLDAKRLALLTLVTLSIVVLVMFLH